MTDADVPMFHAWLRRPHVAEWWGADEAALTLEDARTRYAPRTMAIDNVTPFIALRGDRPIGFAQSYVALGSGDGWWEDETDPGVRGIDQFIAESDLLGQGLGTALVSALVARLFDDPTVTKIQTDPDPANLRAIRCYAKAGFEAIGIVATPDGKALYMQRTRARFAAR